MSDIDETEQVLSTPVRHGEPPLKAAGPPTVTPPKRQSPTGVMLRRAFSLPTTIIGVILLTLLALCAIFADVIAPYGPAEIPGPPFAPPFSEFLLGTDNLGRDVFSRLIIGSRASFAVGIFGAGMAIVIGIIMGSLGGYFGGWLDTLLMRIAELFQIIPALIVALVAAALFGGSLQLVIIVIGLTFWPDTARIVRAQFLTLKERHFVNAAQVAGFHPARIIVSDILPNALPPVIVQAALGVGWAILVEAGLSFLGIGDVNQPSWGQMLSTAQTSLSWAPWLSVLPGIAIVLSVLGFNFLADGFNKAMNPRNVAARVDYRAMKSANDSAAAVRVAQAAAPRADVAAEAEVAHGGTRGQGTPLLTVEDLRFHFTVNGRTVEAVNGVSFHVNHGECVGIVGESGSGKSTIARVLAQLLPPVEVTKLEGKAFLGGQDLIPMTKRNAGRLRQSAISMVFQDPMSHLNPTMKIGAQITEALPSGMSPREAHAEVVRLLERVDLNPELNIPDRYPHQLSGGQRQRAMIALALAMKPQLLIADEPTTALDASVQAQVVDTLLRLHREEGLSILLISHDFGLIANMCERVYVMRQGEFVESADVIELFDNPKHEYTRLLLESVPGFEADNEPGRATATDAEVQR